MGGQTSLHILSEFHIQIDGFGAFDKQTFFLRSFRFFGAFLLISADNNRDK